MNRINSIITNFLWKENPKIHTNVLKFDNVSDLLLMVNLSMHVCLLACLGTVIPIIDARY